MTDIDLNCDMGEYDADAPGNPDASLFGLISSASIACGYHAGNEQTMRLSAAWARARDVVIGAHISYPDKQSFGRRRMQLTSGELRAITLAQLRALGAAARSAGAEVRYVKPHGALYNTMAQSAPVAHAVARAVAEFDPGLFLVGLPGSQAEAASAEATLTFVAEGFPDRGYRADGLLQPRSQPHAVVSDPAHVAARSVALAKGMPVVSVDGQHVAAPVRTICLHSDHPYALRNAQAVRVALKMARVEVRPFAK